jgi:hypothetical protein
VRSRRHGCKTPCRANNARDLVGVGGHNDLIGNSEVGNALPDTDHKGGSANEAKRFSREAGGAKPGGNDGERLHAGLGVARGAANCTPLNLHPCLPIANLEEDERFRAEGVNG